MLILLTVTIIQGELLAHHKGNQAFGGAKATAASVEYVLSASGAVNSDIESNPLADSTGTFFSLILCE